jgi:hypothetical protein
MLGESAIVNPETVMDWKSEELPKIIDGYQLKDVFSADETGLFYNLQPNIDIQRCFLPWWNNFKAEGHCSAELQC